jgi:hypothetical protein
MKTLSKTFPDIHPSGFIKTIASAAVILSLTACGADSLDNIQSDLANGETVNVDLSLNDDGDLVISLNDDNNDDATPDNNDGDNAETINFSLNSEVTVPPANVDGASGDAHITVDTETGAISGSVTVSGLTGTPTAAHIHAGAPGEAGPVVVGLESNDDGTVWSVPEGSALDADGIAQFEAGYLYINVHTEANPPGEIRGQLVDDSVPTAGSLTVTMTNTSPYQPMTPPVVVLHNAPDADNGMRLFRAGQPAIDPIVAIAENGNNAPLVNLLGYLTDQGRASAYAVGFADPANPGPLLPGMTASVDIDLASDDQVMSLVSMVVCTNDGFSGVNSHTLSADESETFMVPIYDAGSETNVLALDYWVPPCGSEANMTDDENGAVMLHPGQSGSENPNFDFAPDTRLLEVTITRN